MDPSSIVSLISSVGFPIVCCIGLAWYVNNTQKELTITIQNNTKVLEKLLTKLNIED